MFAPKKARTQIVAMLGSKEAEKQTRKSKTTNKQIVSKLVTAEGRCKQAMCRNSCKY